MAGRKRGSVITEVWIWLTGGEEIIVHFCHRLSPPPVTSRRPREEELDGQAYRFVTRADMERDIKDSRYLEHGEYDGNLYGTKMDSIHEVVETGRTCILDVNPQVGQGGAGG